MCYMYNLADVTMNMASNEGFGLGTCESLMCGTPISVTVTGGCPTERTEDQILDVSVITFIMKNL